MMLSIRRRTPILLLAAALAASALVVPALAKRPPTPSERSSIRTVVEAFIQKSGSPAAKDNRITKIVVSTVNASYARANTSSPSAGPALAILKRKGRSWKVITFGSGGFGCKLAPKAVLKDLIGGCVPG